MTKTTNSGYAYIHYHFSNAKGISDAYSREAIQQKLESGARQVEAKVSKTGVSKLGLDSLDYLASLGKDIEKASKNNSGVVETSQKLTMDIEGKVKQYTANYFSFTGAPLAARNEKNELANLDSFLGYAKEAVKSVDAVFSGKSVKLMDTLVEDFLFSPNKRKRFYDFAPFDRAVSEFISKHEGKSLGLNMAQTGRGNDIVRKEIFKLKTLIQAAENLASKLTARKVAANRGKEIYFFNELAKRVNESIATIAANLGEYAVANLLDNAVNGFLENVKATVIPRGGSVKVDPALGKKKSQSVPAGGSHVKLKMTTTSSSSSVDLTCNLPGIHVQKINPTGNTKIVNLNLSRNGTLNDALIRGGFKSSGDQYKIMNILGSYLRPVENNSRNKAKGLGTSGAALHKSVCDMLAASNLYHALSGSLSSTNMAYFFMVNGKPYQIPELIRSIGTGMSIFTLAYDTGGDKTTYKHINNQSKFSVDPTMSTWDNAYYRSDELTKALLSASFNIKLKALARDIK